MTETPQQQFSGVLNFSEKRKTLNIFQLQNENKRLRMELEDTPRKQATPAPGTTNFDILRRLSHLENHVFGNKLDNK